MKCPADRDFADFIVEYLTDPLVMIERHSGLMDLVA